ncbi:MAG: OmpA family protein [Candidatus Handelsmanbacteria bacterium]|nr:OmpA family protein [Candidatus Handelsmanbacteria bacterium]
MKISAKLFIALPLCVSLAGLGCSSTAKGGAIGAVAGGAAGALIGKKLGDHTVMGALIGAGVGGTAGALIGKKMDAQADDLKQDLEGAKVERVGEGIKITFASGILFTSGSADLQADGKANVEKMAKILQKYPDTDILVEGHTDADGTEVFNQTLSEKRAANVATFAEGLGVAGARFTTKGYGETRPVGDNTTAEGKQVNRRVEIAIFANEKMKEAAAKGQL